MTDLASLEWRSNREIDLAPKKNHWNAEEVAPWSALTRVGNNTLRLKRSCILRATMISGALAQRTRRRCVDGLLDGSQVAVARATYRALRLRRMVRTSPGAAFRLPW